MSAAERHVEKLVSDVSGVRRKVSTLVARIRTLELRSRRLDVLRRPHADLGHRIDALASVLSPGRLMESIQAAVRSSDPAERPVPHLLIDNLLPADAYDAIVQAIPPSEFFDENERATWEQLMVRTALMPLDAMVTWIFVTDVVAPALAAAVMTRFGETLAVRNGSHADRTLALRRRAPTVVSPRLVRRRPGYMPHVPIRGDSETALAVLYPVRSRDTADYGSRVQTPAASAGIDIPFRRNTALAVVGPCEAHEYAPIPENAGDEAVRDTYQFGIEWRRE